SASQKFGIPIPRIAPPMASWSTQVFRFTAASTPSGIAIRYEIASAVRPRTRLLRAWVASSSVMGVPLTSDVPRSPLARCERRSEERRVGKECRWGWWGEVYDEEGQKGRG